MITRRVRVVVLLSVALLSVALLAAGCGSSGGPSASSGTAASSASASAPAPAPATTRSTGAPTPSSSAATAAPDEASPAASAFSPASTTSTSPGTGNGLSLVAVRTATHPGYDRVVLELGGTGTVGWRIGYDAQPRRQGSGDPVVLAGAATISVLLQGVGYPQDTGVPEYSGPRRLTPSLPSVRELQIGGVFEGQLDAFVGVAARRPFRVVRLTSPQRVVIDVAHAG